MRVHRSINKNLLHAKHDSWHSRHVNKLSFRIECFILHLTHREKKKHCLEAVKSIHWMSKDLIRFSLCDIRMEWPKMLTLLSTFVFEHTFSHQRRRWQQQQQPKKLFYFIVTIKLQLLESLIFVDRTWLYHATRDVLPALQWRSNKLHFAKVFFFTKHL